MKRLNVKHLLAITTVTSALIVAAPPAYAIGELQVVVDGGGRLVDFGGLMPGSTRQSGFSVSNTSGDDAILSLRVVDLREDDDGCEPSETNYGDTTCGDGGGELGRDLTVAVVPLEADGSSSGAAVFDSSVRDLVAWTVADQRLPAGAARSFRLDWELPISSPNDTQTDSVAFDVEFVLEPAVGEGDEALPGLVGPASDVEVFGTRFDPAVTPVRVRGTELPVTGAGPLRAVALGSIALAAGGFLLAFTRLRCRAGS